MIDLLFSICKKRPMKKLMIGLAISLTTFAFGAPSYGFDSCSDDSDCSSAICDDSGHCMADQLDSSDMYKREEPSCKPSGAYCADDWTCCSHSCHSDNQCT